MDGIHFVDSDALSMYSLYAGVYGYLYVQGSYADTL
jgi:hypothetical protein